VRSFGCALFYFKAENIMSMLYSNIQKTLPQTPDDCIKTDKVSSELWTLAEIIES